jgi:hypothetical protein
MDQLRQVVIIRFVLAMQSVMKVFSVWYLIKSSHPVFLCWFCDLWCDPELCIKCVMDMLYGLLCFQKGTDCISFGLDKLQPVYREGFWTSSMARFAWKAYYLEGIDISFLCL